MKRLSTIAFLAIGLFGLAASSAAQVQKSTYRIDVPIELYLTPTQFPCLSETIHVFGTYQEHMLLVITSTGLGHLTIHQTADNITAVGLTTGTKYQDSGPLTVTVTGYPATGTTFEFTVHNINHFVGPGQTDNIYLRTLFHATLDPTTGVAKVDISKDEVLCR
jgi:hypothetical protein